MSLIYTASGDKRSAQHSSRVIEPVLRWFFPHLDQPTVDLIVFLVRKCAHLTEYALLALLVWRAVRKPYRGDRRPWSWSLFGFAVLFCAVYAGSDEIHQLFVPHREGRLHDVVIDTIGASCGLLLLWFLGRLRKQWGKVEDIGSTPPGEPAN